MLEKLLLYGILTTALWYLGIRAQITRFIWRHYPPALESFMDCSACTGFWWGLILAALLGRYVPAFELAATPSFVGNVLLIGLSMIVVTPVIAGVMSHGFAVTGSVTPYPIEDSFADEDEEDEEHQA